MKDYVVEAFVAEWNAHVPEGSPVSLVDDRGKVELTYTRSPAWVLGGEPVVSVKGRSGGYSCRRLVVRPATRPEPPRA